MAELGGSMYRILKRVLAIILFLGVLGSAYIHVISGQWLLILGDAFFGFLMVMFAINPPGDHDV